VSSYFYCRIWSERLLYDAEHDLLATAEFLVKITLRNLVTDYQTNGQVENIMPMPASLAWDDYTCQPGLECLCLPVWPEMPMPASLAWKRHKKSACSTLTLTALPGVEVLKTFGLNTDWWSVSINAVSNGLQQCTLFCKQQREQSTR